MKAKKHLNFRSLIALLSSEFNKIPEWRQKSKVEISLHDAMMSAFACMHFKDPSLLEFQRRLQDLLHRNNLKSLFGVRKIPKETQMRVLIDEVDSEVFRGIFKGIYARLQRGKHLEQYQIFPGKYYFPIDGSQFYSSQEVYCPSCLVQKKKTGETTYVHKVLQGGIMHPDLSEVMPFMAEQIANSDGLDKQDCELNAAKRFLKKLRKDFPKLGFIIGGDALFSKQPLIEIVLNYNMSYIFSIKSGSHKYLFDWLDTYDQLHKLEFIDEDNRRHCYEWMNDVPLHGGEKTIGVNFLKCSVTGQKKDGSAKRPYRHCWITDIKITCENIKTLVRTGRCRWKNENEVFNVMKNHGYCMERNYGHGKKNLAFNFYLFTLLAFFFHQISELTDATYKACRKKFGSKRHLWETLRAYIKIIVFDDWEFLLRYALNPTPLQPQQQPP